MGVHVWVGCGCACVRVGVVYVGWCAGLCVVWCDMYSHDKHHMTSINKQTSRDAHSDMYDAYSLPHTQSNLIFINIQHAVHTHTHTQPHTHTPSQVLHHHRNPPPPTTTYTSVTKKVAPVLGGFDRSNYTTLRFWATAADGVKVPVSLVYRTDMFKQDGSMPMLLDGYGVFFGCLCVCVCVCVVYVWCMCVCVAHVA